MGSFTNSIGDLFGGAQNNAGFTAQGTDITSPTTAAQAQGAYGTAQSGLNQQQQLINALQAQNGVGNQSAVFNQLQGVANGTGPNPAQAMLNQSTAANVANQGALMAGQRGASANPALIARQAAQQGAATQQQAANQGATLQANQQLNALGQLGGLATQQVNQQTGAISGLNSAAQNEQQALLGGINNQNQSNVSQQSNLNNANQSMAAVNANNTAKAVGGLTSGLSGGLVKFAQGGDVPNSKVGAVSMSHRFPSHLREIATLYHPEHMTGFSKPQHFADGGSLAETNAAQTPAPEQSSSFDPSKLASLAMFLGDGGKVPGKSEVKGDSKKNDTVPALLSPGEFVIKKSIMESEDPVAGATKVITDFLKKNGKSAGKEQNDFKGALTRAMQERKSK